MTAEVEKQSYWAGQKGNNTHLTGRVYGRVPIEAVASMRGARGEVPGEHRNKQGEKWDAFKSDIAERGIQHPIFITHDRGSGPRLSEGNHRRDVAMELGHTHVPVEVAYSGHAERGDYLFGDKLNRDQFAEPMTEG